MSIAHRFAGVLTSRPRSWQDRRDPASTASVAELLFRLYGAYFLANAAMGVVCVVDAAGWPPAVLPALLFSVFWALMGQILTPILLPHLLFAGPPVVSHDVVPRNIVGPGVLVAVLLVVAAGACARAWAAGRWLSYACVAAVTLAVGIDFLAWVRQGL